MPRSRRREPQTRPTTQAAPPVPPAPPATGTKSPPNADEDIRTPLNLPVIRRHIPRTRRIISLASYCTVYKISSGQWYKPDIEGTLFLLDVTPPTPDATRYHAFILNRKGLSNLLIPLPRKLELV